MVTLDQVYELSDTAQWRGHGREQGPYLHMACPFHGDDKPSLLAFEDGWFRCQSDECNQTGQLDKLYTRLVAPDMVVYGTGERTKSWPPRLPHVEDRRGTERLIWDAHDVLMRNDGFRWYLKLRGVADRVETAKLGWYEGWITVPILSKDQEVHGLYLRATRLTERLTGLRFTQPTSQKPMLYCPDWALLKKKTSSVFVVFGMMDALGLSSLRFPVVTTTGGSKSFNPEWLEMVRKKIVIIPDATGDSEAARRLSAGLGWRGEIVELPYDDDIQDPADYLKREVGRGEELKRLLSKYV